MAHNETLTNQYMVYFDVPTPTPEYILDLIPDQHAALNNLFAEGIVLSYSVAADRTKVFALFTADHEEELIQHIERLPMSPYMDYDFKELMMHNVVYHIPAMSLN